MVTIIQDEEERWLFKGVLQKIIYGNAERLPGEEPH